MFKRTGAPVNVTKVSFDLKTAEEIFCPNCKAYVGLRSGGTYKRVGQKAEIPLAGFQAKCPKCESSFNV